MNHVAQSGQLRRLEHRGYAPIRTRDIQPGERSEHRHDFYEVDLIWSGAMHFEAGGRSYHLTNGDILLIAPGVPHRPEPDGEPGFCERVVLWIAPDFLRQFRAFGFDPAACFRGDPAGSECCLRFDDETTWHIGELLDRCLREYDSEEPGAVMMADTSLVQVMILINRLSRRSVRGEHRDRSSALVSGVQEYINGHYAEELTLDSLAGHFFISKYHLSREFGRIVGTSVHRYIIQKRLVVAKQLLSEGRSSSMVCQHCGFGDYSNFYRAFKNEYGMSPKEYASNIREDAIPSAERNREIRGSEE